MPIDSIAIQYVRGIRRRITLELNGQSLLLHGDNGSGKSSIERALRWALAGREEPTSDLPHTSEESYRTHVLASEDGGQPEVTVTFTDGSSVTVRHGQVEADGAASEVREACERSLPFLRRSELLDVLSSRPVDRFRYFESFLGLGDADNLIKQVADLKGVKEKRSTDLQNRHGAEIDALRPLLPEPLQNGVRDTCTLEAAAITWLAEVGVIKNDASWESAGEVLAEFNESSEDDLEERRTRLRQFADDARAFHSAVDAVEAHPESFDEQRRLLETEIVEATQLDLLEHALAHFQRTEGQTCPICGKEIDWTETEASLVERTRRLNTYAEVVRRQERAAREWLRIWWRFPLLRERFSSLFPEAEVGEAFVSAPPGLELLDREEEESRLLHSVVSIQGRHLEEFLGLTAAKMVEAAEDAASSLPKHDQLPQVRLMSSLFERYGKNRTFLKLLESELNGLAAEVSIWRPLHEALRRARQDIAAETFHAIGERVREYYFSIHPQGDPEDETGAPAIEVQRHGSGTAFVRGSFAGSDVKNPQWVYSDGHLDTVAICIFLALRRYRVEAGDSAQLLILDDIVLSIDLGHARRFIDLLKEEFLDHQILLFTHNGLFAHWCATLVPGLRRLQIKHWSLADGPHIGDYLQSRERLESSTATAQPKEIGQHLMWLMEEWLAEARFVFRLSVQAQPDERYTLTDIWLPFVKVVKKLGKQLQSDLGGAVPAVERLSDLPQVRNSLPAHENEFAKEFPRPVMAEIARDCLIVVDGLYCRECRSFAKPIPYRSNPSIMHCQCRAIQYVPPAKR